MEDDTYLWVEEASHHRCFKFYAQPKVIFYALLPGLKGTDPMPYVLDVTDAGAFARARMVWRKLRGRYWYPFDLKHFSSDDRGRLNLTISNETSVMIGVLEVSVQDVLTGRISDVLDGKLSSQLMMPRFMFEW